MASLEVGDKKHVIPTGETVIGSGPDAAIRLDDAVVAEKHAIIQGLPDGQVAVRTIGPEHEVLVNGVQLGPQPHPLIHGDKVEIAGFDMLFVDDKSSGSTQYISALDPAALAAAGAGSKKKSSP